MIFFELSFPGSIPKITEFCLYTKICLFFFCTYPSVRKYQNHTFCIYIVDLSVSYDVIRHIKFQRKEIRVFWSYVTMKQKAKRDFFG